MQILQMGLSLFSSPMLLLVFLEAFFTANADTLQYDWTVSYAVKAVLGVKKQVIMINNQFPGPTLTAKTNDVVDISVHNHLEEPFLLTWNGIQLRRNSWQDGVQGTNCPIAPGESWTYSFQIKDQIGSFFYFPSLLLQKAAGGYGAIRVNNRPVVPIPFSLPHDEFDVLIGDWYFCDYRDLRASLDRGVLGPPAPDGIIINGLGPNQTTFTFKQGATYRLRISNVGLKASINFRIQDHTMLLVETEGSYTVKQSFQSLDVHVGQSYSVLVTADQPAGAYYIVASSRFSDPEVSCIALLRYSGFIEPPSGPYPPGPDPLDIGYSMEQARAIRWDPSVGAARPNPQGSFPYRLINISRTIILENGAFLTHNQRQRYTVNGISFVYPDTPLKLADYFQLPDVFSDDAIPSEPDGRRSALGTSVMGVKYRSFVHIVLQNREPTIQTWHTDGYNFFVVGMDYGTWDESLRSTYNMLDAVSRSTTQVLPDSWTAIMMEMDNPGMWNFRSQDAERRYLGQEFYMRIEAVPEDDPSSSISSRDEAPIPANVIRCGRAASV